MNVILAQIHIAAIEAHVAMIPMELKFAVAMGSIMELNVRSMEKFWGLL